MRLSLVLYRLRQFKNAVVAVPDQEELALAASILTPAQLALFHRLQPGEQAHSLQVLKKLAARNVTEAGNLELQAAALLHDVGKCLYRLHLWERVWIVLGQALFPGQVEQWGRLPAPGRMPQAGDLKASWWRRPFIVAVQHPEWGAELASQAGSSPLVASLIRRHQKLLPEGAGAFEDRLLKELQRVDGNS